MEKEWKGEERKGEGRREGEWNLVGLWEYALLALGGNRPPGSPG